MTDTPLIETPGLKELMAERPELFSVCEPGLRCWVHFDDKPAASWQLWTQSGGVRGVVDVPDFVASAIIEKRLREWLDARPHRWSLGKDFGQRWYVLDEDTQAMLGEGDSPIAALIAAVRAAEGEK